MEQTGKQAIVMGASMAGLMAARVLSDRFERVLLLDRDPLPDEAVPRRGVPQGAHTHGLLAGGARVLERLFPGLHQEMLERGAIQADIGRDARWFQRGGYMSRPTTGLDGLLTSRALLEACVRQRVLAISNVEVHSGCQAEGLLFDSAKRRVEGVNTATGPLRAELTVDTTGRGSKLPARLEAAGYPSPEEERVEVDLHYTTRNFRRTGSELNGDVAVISPPTPEGKRGGVLLAQENGTWIVTLLGHFGQAAPADLTGFLEYACHLPSRDIYEALATSEPIGEARITRFPASIRKRYERLERFPEGLLALGDALCSFNPIYGQGMSVAALEAEALAAELRFGEVGIAPRFFTKASAIIDTPWSIAVGNDLRIPETNGPHSAATRLINWYVGKLLKASHHDQHLAIAFHEVGNLVAPPSQLMRPVNMLRTLLGNLLRPGKPTGAEAASAVSARG